MNIMISFANLERIFFLIILPLIITIILFTIFTIFFRKQNLKDRPEYTIYVINYWSNIIGILFAAIVTGLVIGFCSAFVATLRKYGAVSQNQFLYYFLIIFPIMPFSILAIYVSKLLKILRYREEHTLDYKEGAYYVE